jgi:Fe-S oxidoreductase
MAEEASEEMPGLTIPIEQEGAEMLYLINAREAKFYPQDIAEAAMIFHAAGQSFTFARHGWEATNLAMFAGDIRTAASLVRQAYDAAKRLGVKKIGMTECGHAYRAMRYEGPYWLGLPGGEPPLPVVHSVQLFAEYLEAGRLTIDPAKRIAEPATYQDACNISRGGGLWEEARFLMRSMFTDFREMQPNREYNQCCGGGGGFVPMGGPYKRRRMESGRIKAEQIRASGAKIVVAPCHNCFDQLKDLNVEYDLGVRVIHFKTVLPSMLILPEEMKPTPAEE